MIGGEFRDFWARQEKQEKVCVDYLDVSEERIPSTDEEERKRERESPMKRRLRERMDGHASDQAEEDHGNG